MKASEIVEAVNRKVLDSSYSTADILTIVNRGVLEIAGGGDRSHGNAKLAPLPDLFSSATITLTGGSPTVAMPATYHRGLTRVVYAGQKLKRYDSHIKFLDDYEGRTGAPEAYCLKGNTLWLLPISSTNVALTVYFTRLPVDMAIVAYSAGPPVVTAVDSSPDGLPVDLHHKLLVNFACKEIFSEIEQGLDGAIPDTLKHTAEYQKALTDLERLIGFEDGEATNINDEYFQEENIF